MEALYLLVPLSVILVFLAIWIFFGMSDSGQFEDMEGPAMRILLDDDMAAEPSLPSEPQRDRAQIPGIWSLAKKEPFQND